MLNNLDSNLRLQIEMAARGGISGELKEWPVLVKALRLCGYDLPLDTLCNPTVRKICKKLVD